MSNRLNYTTLPRTTLGSLMDATQLDMSLATDAGPDFPLTDFQLVIGPGTLTVNPTLAELALSETVHVKSRTDDNLLLYSRNVNGNASPLTHASGQLVQMLWTPGDVSHLNTKIEDLEYLISVSLGSLTTGVRNIGPAYTELKVVEQGTLDMTVKIKAGAGFSLRKSARLRADFDTIAFIAPSSLQRIDLVSIDSATDLIVVTPGIEGDPVEATPTGHIALARITLQTGTTTITDSGEITDVRTDL